jgi:hypothetical protein
VTQQSGNSGVSWKPIAGSVGTGGLGLATGYGIAHTDETKAAYAAIVFLVSTICAMAAWAANVLISRKFVPKDEMDARLADKDRQIIEGREAFLFWRGIAVPALSAVQQQAQTTDLAIQNTQTAMQIAAAVTGNTHEPGGVP